MGKRAARGAGLPWGLAEEAGKAARWLTARGLPGPEELAEILTRNDGKSYDELAPVSAEGVWHAPSGRLCPLVAGAALCDRAAEIAAGREIEFGPTAQPLLLAPYAAGAARLTGAAVELSWAGAVMSFTPEGVSIEGDPAALTARSADSVQCRHAENAVVAPPVGAPGRVVDAETWSRLNAFAQRTFAPATEASRLAGAGAGLTDND
ncbi:MAG: DUF3726 domain-containing protein [Inquilinus sp.]|nr:DUF3726 domain-containing protein [Inquilinus sp.]